MPGKDLADSPGTNSVLESVEPEYYDDFLTSQSLGGLDSHHMMSQSNIVSQRNSRTLTSNLFGWREVGDDDEASGDKKMWMIVITVASGLVMVSIIAVLVACRPKHSQTSDLISLWEDISRPVISFAKIIFCKSERFWHLLRNFRERLVFLSYFLW